jgi:perosamine synthetase
MQGPEVAAFEREFATAVGAIRAVAVSNCTTGLHLAMQTLGIQRGDEVVVPSFSYIASTNSVVHSGGTPVYADIDPTTGNLDRDTVTAVLTPRTRAVMAVHQAGNPVDLAPLRELCDTRGIALFEDAACAIGSAYQGSPIGSHSDLVVFSLHPRKLVTTGEGGMIALRSDDHDARLRRLRQHGMDLDPARRHEQGGTEQYLECGYNFRLTDIQAAVGREQLRRLPAMMTRRRALAARYDAALRELRRITLPRTVDGGETNHQSYWIAMDGAGRHERDAAMAALAAEGVSTRRGIMCAHREPAGAAHASGPLPNSERLSDSSLILPLYHQMTRRQQDRVIGAVLRHLS